MKIEITQDCIKKGVKSSTSRCPVALGMKNAGFKDVKVGIFDADYIFDFKDGNFIWGNKRLPKKNTNFIARFDERKPVKPISFLLTI